jgi:hypothetical protein
MASPPREPERKWSASPWLPLAYADVIHAPDTFGVLILGDRDQEPVLVSHGVIREEAWRFLHSSRSAADRITFFRFVETLMKQEAERLAHIVREELAKNTGHTIAWMDLPAPPLVSDRDRPEL